MGKLISCKNWDQTPVGNPSLWPQVLHNTLSIVLPSKFPMVLYWGTDLIAFYNDAFRPNLGELKHPWALGKTCFELWPEAWGIVQPMLEKVYSTSQAHCEADRLIPVNRKGYIENVYWTFSCSPVLGESNKVQGILFVCYETTDKINLRNTILHAPVAMCILKGPQHIVDIINKKMLELWDKSDFDLAGKPILEVLPEAKGRGFETILDNVYKTGESFKASEVPMVLSRPGGLQTVHVTFVYEPFREVDNRVSGVMVVATEATDQVLARQKTQQAEESMQLAIESAHLGSYRIDFVTNDIKTSERFNRIWGVEKPQSWAEYASRIHPDDVEIRESAHHKSLLTGNLDYEARIVWDDGSVHWIKVKGKLLFDTEGKPATLIGVIQDITEHKLFADELQKQVQQRTEELQAANEELAAMNEELSDTNTHLLRANRELEEYAHVASHDLQEPLRKIQVFIDVLNQRFRSELSPEAQVLFQKINNSASRMSSLIKDLLEYSRLAYNEGLFRTVDLNEVLENVINDFEILIERKQIHIQASLLPTVHAIPIHINQLFYNLIGNAVKFSRKGVQPRIGIASRSLSSEEVKQFASLRKDTAYCELSFSDNGIGFSQAYAEQIFNIFQRLNDKSMYGGYGIGLALCRRIVNNHDGIIYARGEENQGATFYVILPVSKQE